MPPSPTGLGICASDGHNACLNSKGRAGLVRGTPDPENGHLF
jgi:hypothetical protein